jgi:hypothetical protein
VSQPSDEPRADLGEPWEHPTEEYEVLVDVILPVALSRFSDTFSDWDALDSKAMGILALDAGVIGLLITVHRTLNDLWLVPAAILVAAGILMIAALWPRGTNYGPGLFDFHATMGKEEGEPLGAAREMLRELADADAENVTTYGGKTSWFWIGLLVMLLGLIGCIPVALFRPGYSQKHDNPPAIQKPRNETGRPSFGQH